MYAHPCIESTSHSRKEKILWWFEQTFARVSGDDQLLQLDEFRRALQINGVSVCIVVPTVIVNSNH